MIKATPKQLEQILGNNIDKNVEYWGNVVGEKEFGFYSLTDEKWLFWPQQFFIDIIKNQNGKKQGQQALFS